MARYDGELGEKMKSKCTQCFVREVLQGGNLSRDSICF